MTETRNLAAIMAIDVVGYSRLMGEDESGTARAVREHREAAEPLIARRGGRIVKTMGDGLLLEFFARGAEIPAAKRIVYRVALAERAGAGSATPPYKRVEAGSCRARSLSAPGRGQRPRPTNGSRSGPVGRAR